MSINLVIGLFLNLVVLFYISYLTILNHSFGGFKSEDEAKISVIYLISMSLVMFLLGITSVFRNKTRHENKSLCLTLILSPLGHFLGMLFLPLFAFPSLLYLYFFIAPKSLQNALINIFKEKPV